MEAIRHPLMFDAQEMEHGGVEVVYVDDVLDGVVAEFIGVAIAGAAFDPAAGHPHGEAFDMVIATGALRHGRAAKFTAPDNESVFEHAALLEVADEGSGALVDESRRGVDAVFDSTVVLPAAVIQLDEPDTALGNPAGEQAVGGKGAIAAFGAVHV